MTTAQQAVAGGVAKYIKGVVNTKPHLPGSNDVFWKKMRVAVSFSAAAVLVFLLLGAADAAYLHRLKPGEVRKYIMVHRFVKANSAFMVRS